MLLLSQVLLDAKVVSVKDAVLQISTEATQESALEELPTKVKASNAIFDSRLLLASCLLNGWHELQTVQD